MSRTDKDAPDWAQAEWWEPQHYRCQYWYQTRYLWRASIGDRECDLPNEPVRQPHRWGQRQASCVWVPWLWPPLGTKSGWHRCFPHVPTSFVSIVGTRPTRRKIRDGVREAIKEYRATGEVTTILPTDQHRHGAAWLWY